MIKVLGKASSINVRKVLWACDEMGIAYKREDWGDGFRSTRSPEFLALNPNGLVPVLVDDDLVLRESNTIVRYLATKHARVDLLPSAPGERALVEMWMDWQATEFNTAWRYAFQALARKNPAFHDKAQLTASIQNWTEHLAILDAHLAQTRAFVHGETFTVADIPIGLSVNRWFMTPLERPLFPAVSDYYERLSQRPAFMTHGRNGTP